LVVWPLTLLLPPVFLALTTDWFGGILFFPRPLERPPLFSLDFPTSPPLRGPFLTLVGRNPVLQLRVARSVNALVGPSALFFFSRGPCLLYAKGFLTFRGGSPLVGCQSANFFLRSLAGFGILFFFTNQPFV